MGIYLCNLIFIHVVFSVLLLVIRSVWKLLLSSVGIKSYKENCICLPSTLLRQPRTALMESPSSSKNAPRRSKTELWTSRCVLPLYVVCVLEDINCECWARLKGDVLLLFFLKGIYRVNGAKSRVEKLCQAFENGKDLVELSDLYPHDISNVLKLYLRQVSVKLIFTNIFLMFLIYLLLLAIITFIYLRNFFLKLIISPFILFIYWF